MIKEDPPKRCVHFYACVCAFASDDKLAEEFAYYINLDNTGNSFVFLITFHGANIADSFIVLVYRHTKR